jgi:hypothetical protein
MKCHTNANTTTDCALNTCRLYDFDYPTCANSDIPNVRIQIEQALKKNSSKRIRRFAIRDDQIHGQLDCNIDLCNSLGNGIKVEKLIRDNYELFAVYIPENFTAITPIPLPPATTTPRNFGRSNAIELNMILTGFIFLFVFQF